MFLNTTTFFMETLAQCGLEEFYDTIITMLLCRNQIFVIVYRAGYQMWYLAFSY